jgi:hypothetical protein
MKTSGAVAAPARNRGRSGPARPESRRLDVTGPSAGPGLTFAEVEPLLRQVRSALKADAVTVAVRSHGDERLLVCTSDGRVREAHGSISLGLVSRGPTKLAGGAGLLQAVECCSLFGFAPNGYLGAPFGKRARGVTGGIAAWSRRPRRWAVADGSLLRKLAIQCESRIGTLEPAAV